MNFKALSIIKGLSNRAIYIPEQEERLSFIIEKAEEHNIGKEALSEFLIQDIIENSFLFDKEKAEDIITKIVKEVIEN